VSAHLIDGAIDSGNELFGRKRHEQQPGSAMSTGSHRTTRTLADTGFGRPISSCASRRALVREARFATSERIPLY
jgi:hypothetical protein